MESSDLSRSEDRRGDLLPSSANNLRTDGNRTDAELIQACLEGDEIAWKDLIDRYGRLVYSVPRRYGLSASDADDVFQNVFSLVFRRLAGLRDQQRLAPWLITISYRETQRVLKKAPPSKELDEAMPDGNDPPLDQVQAWERQHLVHRALEQLGSPCRDLLTALFLDSSDASYEQVSARLGVPLGSVGPMRARCFRKLEAILARLGIDTSA